VASLYRPVIVSYALPNGSYRTPDGKRVTKNMRQAKRTVSRSPVWHGRYTDRNGERHQVKLSESKEIARRMLAKLSGDSQLSSVGLGDDFEEHRGRPLLEHLEDFRRYLLAKGNVERYVATVFSHCRELITGCRFEEFRDIQPSAIVEFLAGLRTKQPPALSSSQREFDAGELAALLGVARASVWRMVKRGQAHVEGQGRSRRFSRETVDSLLSRRGGIGIQTSNHHLTSIKQFSKWMVKDRRSPDDPLAGLSRQNASTDVRRSRRALARAEFAALLAAAAQGKDFRGVSGGDRAMLYRVASQTGLRASELASLTPASFDLTGDTPTVTVEAAYSKHRRRDVQPIRADVAAVIVDYLGKKAKGPVWPGTWPDAGAEMIRLDLAAAGIPYVDDAGRVYDFHSIRHQFISDLAAAGVHPKAAQELARHSTITLTMNHYTHLGIRDRAAALDRLPPMDRPDDRAANQRQESQNPKDRCKARARRAILVS
jgi:integrase